MSPTQSLIALALALALAIAPVAASVAFQSDASCPVEAALPALARIDGATDRRSCLVECAARPDCSVVHARLTGGNRSCYLAGYANWTSPDAWQTSAGCETLVRRPSLPAALAGRLIAFYNFRVGYDNLAGSATPAAQPTLVSRSRDGASLGSMAANIEVIGPLGLTAAAGFTYFAKLKVAFAIAAVLPLTLHVTYNSTPDLTTGWWKIMQNSTSLLHRSVLQTEVTATGLPGFGLSTALPAPISLAVAYDPVSGAFKFFTAGRQVTPGSISTSLNAGGTADGRLRIGYNTVDQMAGHVICYAIAGVVLTEAELQLMDSMC